MHQDSLDQSQQQAFNIFKQEINSTGFDDQYQLRFLRARQFDVVKATEMWNNFIDWRKKNDIDNISQFEFSEIDQVRQYYPHGYFQIDKQCRPIYIERIGMINVQQLWKVTTEERMLKYLSQTYENLINVIFPALSQRFQKNICKNLVIFDLKGLSLGSISHIKSFIQLVSQLTQNNYPEILGGMYIINAPMFFSGAWKVIKGFFDQNTQKKIQILDSKFQTVLLNNIEIENLPTFLGGKGNCDLAQNKGPWNENGQELYGSQNDIKQKNKKFNEEDVDITFNQNQQEIEYKLEYKDKIDFQEFNHKKLEQENEEDFVSIDNNQLFNGRKSDQSNDIFLSLSDNRMINRDSVDYKSTYKRSINDQSNNQQDFKTINDIQSTSNKENSQNNQRGQNFVTFGSIDNDKRRLYSVDYVKNQNNDQMKIKINPNECAVQIYKNKAIIEIDNFKQKDELTYLFMIDKVSLQPDKINLSSESQQVYSLSPNRYYILIGHLALIYAIFMSNYSLYSNQQLFANHFNKSYNQINLINYTNMLLTGLFYILLIFLKPIRLQQIGSIICLLGVQIKLVDSYNYLFVGQCLVGVAKPFILLNQQNIVIQWFPPQNRSLIYNIISINTIIACAISFIIKRDKIDQIFLIEAIICSFFILFGNIIYLSFSQVKSPISIQAERIQIFFKSLDNISNFEYAIQSIKKIKKFTNFQLLVQLLFFGFQFNALKTQMLILQPNQENGQYENFTIYLTLILCMIFLVTFIFRYLKQQKWKFILLQLIGILFIFFQDNWIQIKSIQFLNIGLFIITPIILKKLLLQYDIIDQSLIISFCVFFGNITSFISCIIIDQSNQSSKNVNKIICIYQILALFCYLFIKQQDEDFEQIKDFQIITLNDQNDQQIIHCF